VFSRDTVRSLPRYRNQNIASDAHNKAENIYFGHMIYLLLCISVKTWLPSGDLGQASFPERKPERGSMIMKTITVLILLGMAIPNFADASETRQTGMGVKASIKYLKTSATPEFKQTGKTPVARVRLRAYNKLTNHNGFFDWKVDGQVVNPVVKGELSMQCSSTSHLTYLAYQLKLPHASSPEVVYEESVQKAGISGKHTQLAIRPFKNDQLVEACIAKLKEMNPSQWGVPFTRTLKVQVTAIGRCSGGTHPNHLPSRLIKRKYPVTMTLKCSTNVRKN